MGFCLPYDRAIMNDSSSIIVSGVALLNHKFVHHCFFTSREMTWEKKDMTLRYIDRPDENYFSSCNDVMG